MKRALSSPLEPQVVDFGLQRRESHSPFMIVPLEVVEQIFPLLSRNDLFHFEQACWSHSTLTDKTWKVLREKDFLDHLNWEVCQESHRSNYLLSKVIIHYVKTLPGFESLLSEEQRNKFAAKCEKFPPFEAKETIEICQSVLWYAPSKMSELVYIHLMTAHRMLGDVKAVCRVALEGIRKGQLTPEWVLEFMHNFDHSEYKETKNSHIA